MTTAADIIVASVQANPPGGDVSVSPAVRVLVEEIVRLRADFDRLRLRERVCDSECGPIQVMAEAWYRAEEEFDLPDEDPYAAVVRLQGMLEDASAAKMKLLPIFQFIGFAETGIEHGAKAITDEWLARLAKHAKTADAILKDAYNV